MTPYDDMAAVYDLAYEAKDYPREAAMLRWIIAAKKRSSGNTLLDVACGTGKHMAELQRDFAVQGLDLSTALLAVAQRRLLDVTFHLGDMSAFNLGAQFDVVTCLFSAIGHVETVEKLNATLRCFSSHARPGGVVIVEPWFTPEQYHPGAVHRLFIDKPDIKFARMNLSEVQGALSIMALHHLVGTPSGIQHFVERLEMGLFTHQEYLDAFTNASLDVTFDSEGLIGRGLYVGVKKAKGAKA